MNELIYNTQIPAISLVAFSISILLLVGIIIYNHKTGDKK